jgi:transcriptional regulator GlxA family with amidase domain
VKVAELLLLRHSTASPPCKVLPSTGLTRKQASRVLDYIEANLERELTLAELAQIVGVRLHHFARMFRRTMGMAPIAMFWSAASNARSACSARPSHVWLT